VIAAVQDEYCPRLNAFQQKAPILISSCIIQFSYQCLILVKVCAAFRPVTAFSMLSEMKIILIHSCAESGKISLN